MLYLASKSPRRKKLLERVSVPFEVLPVDADERPPRGLPPEQVPVLISQNKASKGAEKQRDGTILAADTAVIYQQELMGKPESKQDATQKLEKLQGTTHQIVTGVTLMKGGKRTSMSCESRVEVRALERAEINEYVETGKPLDRAGGYGIQDESCDPVASVDGCPANVLGLPICLLPELFDELDLVFDGSITTGCSPAGSGNTELIHEITSF